MRAFVLAFLCVACSSADLGSERQPSVTVNTTSPTFEKDIVPLLKAKCSTCHSESRTQFVPGNTPNNAQLNNLENAENFAAKAVLIQWRALSDPDNPMPPRFATGLTDDEKAALGQYISTLSPGIR